MPIASIIGTAVSQFAGGGAKDEKGLYQVNEFNWYQSLPYGFSFYNLKASENYGNAVPTSTVYLPIAPNNINIVTHFATNIITTLYGIVEEHSEVRYYDITIAGTTGIAPRYTQPFSGISSITAVSPGRQNFNESTVSPLLGSIASVSAIATLSNPLNGFLQAAPDLLAANDANNKNHSGVGTRQTGYWAFHQLYQFFLKYKNDASQTGVDNDVEADLVGGLISGAAKFLFKKDIGSAFSGVSEKERKVHPIQFLNYKDGNKYDCVPISFTLTRSSENPMMYHYNIKLRAFNMRSVTTSPAAASQLAKLGITGSVETDSLFQSFGGAVSDITAFMSNK